MVGRLGGVTALAALLVAVVLLTAACTGSDSADDGGDGSPQAADSSSPSSVVAGVPPTELRWTSGDDVVCDGAEHRAGTVRGAEPGEIVELDSPMPIELPAAVADDEGNYVLRWTCDPTEAGLRWDLTATGAESGQSVRFAVGGASAPLEQIPVTVTVYDDGLVCDGLRHEVGVIEGLSPGESVRFESEQGGDRSLARAGGDGALVVGWSCRLGDVDQRWEITVTAEGTDRTTAFSLTGLAWPDDGPVVVVSAEPEVLCDRRRQTVASLDGLFPFERVTFSSPQARGVIRDGKADGEGRLDLSWSCERIDVGTSWEVTATATESEESVVVAFVGVEGPPPEPATARLVEDPFRCDGERRPVAALGGFDPGEFVDFTSPQSGPLLEGRADGVELMMNWQCTPSQAGTVWEVTATGRESGRSVTVTVTGATP